VSEAYLWLWHWAALAVSMCSNHSSAYWTPVHSYQLPEAIPICMETVVCVTGLTESIYTECGMRMITRQISASSESLFQKARYKNWDNKIQPSLPPNTALNSCTTLNKFCYCPVKKIQNNPSGKICHIMLLQYLVLPSAFWVPLKEKTFPTTAGFNLQPILEVVSSYLLLIMLFQPLAGSRSICQSH
jgi:hypothetical protein